MRPTSFHRVSTLQVRALYWYRSANKVKSVRFPVTTEHSLLKQMFLGEVLNYTHAPCRVLTLKFSSEGELGILGKRNLREVYIVP